MEKITSINEKGKIFKTSIYSDGLKYQRRKIYINKGIYKVIDLDSEKNLTRTRHYSNGILESESILEGKNLITKNFNTKGEVKESILENFNTGEKLTQKYENNKLKSQSLEFREKLGVKYKKEYKRTFNDKGEIEKEAYAGFHEVRNFFKNVLSRMFDEEKRGKTIKEAVDKYSEKIKKERVLKTVDEIEFFRNEIIKKYDKWSNLVFEKEKTYDGEIIQKKYHENGNIRQELEYKPFMNSYFSDEGVGVIQRKEALPVKEKNYNEAGKLINEKTNEYQKQDGVFELKKSIEIDYKNGFKIEEKIREYENSGMTLTNEKINNYEKEKVIEKLDNGTYKVEFWHNEIAFERAIYPNENINDHKPLEQKIYENGKLYSETYFNYEKNEELNTVYNENGEKKLKSVANFNEGIRIMDNYFEGTEQVSKREYLEANTYELEKQEIFNKKGQLIERLTWNEGELVLKKKYNEKEQITKGKIVINKTSKIEKQGIVDRSTRERSREKVRGNEK